jgi:hypothetical protein
MNPWAKLSLVLGGYIVACLVAYGAVYINDLLMDPAVLQGSGGMSAFGDLILFVGVFGVFALLPTGLGLFFLVRKFLNSSSV